MRSPEQRLLRLCLYYGAALVLGLGYAWIVPRFGGIPCVFRLITGLRCPGCGVTRMCICILHGDFAGAVRENMAVFCMLPAFALLLITRSVDYVRTGRRSLFRWENVMAWIMIAVLLAFGVIRNILGI